MVMPHRPASAGRRGPLGWEKEGMVLSARGPVSAAGDTATTSSFAPACFPEVNGERARERERERNPLVRQLCPLLGKQDRRRLIFQRSGKRRFLAIVRQEGDCNTG